MPLWRSWGSSGNAAPAGPPPLPVFPIDSPLPVGPPAAGLALKAPLAALHGGGGPSFRVSEKKQKVTQGTTFLENPPSLRGSLVTLRPMDSRSIVRALGRCRSLLLRTVLSMVLVASRHSARRSGGEGANQKNVPLEQVPLAGSTPLKGRQADFYTYQSGRRSTANSEASPNQKSHRTALYSPAEVDAPRAAPRKGFLNRRFKRAFAYFSRARKVGPGSGGGQPTG